MRFLLRALLVGIVVYSVLSAVRRMFAPSGPPARRRTSNAGKLVKDPVCGMYVAEETALQAGGSSFCSEDCRQKYLER
jgi:hypothetical protein